MTISQIPLSYDQLIGTIQQSRILLIDMMSQLETHTLLNGNSKSFSIGKEESTDSSSPSLASSEQQYEMVHSILMKNEQETKRLKQHYEDRLKDISNERDQFMRDVLESKFKLENQKTLIEQFKVKNIELEQLVNCLQKEKEEMSETVANHCQKEDQFKKDFIELKEQVVLVKDQADRFSENVKRIHKLQEDIVRLNKNLQHALKHKLVENQDLHKDNMDLKSLLIERNCQMEKYEGTLIENENQLKRVQNDHLQKLIVMEQRLDGREGTEIALNEVQVLLDEALKKLERKDKELRNMTVMYQESLSLLSKMEHEEKLKTKSEEVERNKKEMEYENQVIALNEQIARESMVFEQVVKEKKELEETIRVQKIQIDELVKDNQEKSDLSNEYCSKVELQQNQIKKGETRNKELSDSLAELQHKYQTVQQENKALLSTKNQQLEEILHLQSQLEEVQKARFSKELPSPITTTTLTSNSDDQSSFLMDIQSLNTTSHTSPPSMKPCVICDQPALGLMITCSSCESKVHGTCISDDISNSFTCDACLSDSNYSVKRSSSMAGLKEKRKLKKVSFRDS